MEKTPKLQGLENGQQDGETCQLLVVLGGGGGEISKILQFPRRPTSLLDLCVVFHMLYFIQQMPNVTGIQSQLSPILLKTPVVADCQACI